MSIAKIQVHSGERLYPETPHGVDVEMKDQFDRYVLATQYAKDADCLDAACGAGYGTKMLSGVARQVLGLDFSEEALTHAREHYSADNVQFRQADLNKLLALESDRFDVVVSFETIEHLHQQQQLVKEFHRILRPGGVLLMSSPNGTVTRLANEPPNPFHIHELSNRELTDILASNSFSQEALYGQWRYTHVEKPSLIRSKGFKSVLNAAYQAARNLKRSKTLLNIARRLKVSERFSSFMGQARYVPTERITSDLADSYKVLIAVARKL